MAGPAQTAALAQARRLETSGRAEDAARAFAAAGAVEEVTRVLRGVGRLDVAARILGDAGFFLEAAHCHLEAGDAAAGLERILRLSPKDPRYRAAAREAVLLACRLGTLGVRFEQFVRGFIASGPGDEGDVSAFHELGELYLKQGMPENAEEVLAKIQERFPGHGDVQERLHAMRRVSPTRDGSLANVFAEDERFRRVAHKSRTPVPAAPEPASADAPAPASTRQVARPAFDGEAAPILSFAAGTLVADRYRIEAEIGRGGMATVYRAEDVELSERVALKVFRPTPRDDEGIARFRQELKLSRRLQHKNIARLYDIGIHHGQRYISMELLIGHSLEDVAGSQWPLRRGLDCLIQVCEGLQAAHSQSVIHRDIKPANLFLTQEGLAKIMDFGIARERAAPGMTQAGMLIGTPEYLSPEQIRGGTATEASDLYALGIVAYEMFTGRKPFLHDDLLPLLQMQLLTEPVPPSQHKPGLPAALETVILTLLRKDPQERFPSARALADALISIRESSRG